MAEYIRRDDVLEKLTTVFKLQASTAKAIIESIPAADVVEADECERAYAKGWEYGEKAAESRRKKGKWIGGELGHCSCCGNEGCFSDIWPDGQERYCPYCGADMRGEDDG